MTELFESTMDNVSDIDIKCYSDPDPEHAVLEIFATSGEEAYMYKFTGPGVRINGLYKLMTNNEKLRSENQNLKEENKNLKREKEEREVSAVAAKEKSKLLEIENEKLEKELGEWKKEAADCLRLRDEFRREKNKEINKLKQQLQQVEFDKKRLTWENKQLKKELSLEKDANEAQHNNTRADILEQAKKCVCGHREQDYGTPESNFQLIADLWNGYLGFMDHPQDQIRATDVAMLMALMKIARIKNGGGSGDSFVDLAGYAACGGEIWHGERHSDK